MILVSTTKLMEEVRSLQGEHHVEKQNLFGHILLEYIGQPMNYSTDPCTNELVLYRNDLCLSLIYNYSLN